MSTSHHYDQPPPQYGAPPPQQGIPQPQYGGPPPVSGVPPKKRKKWPWVLGGLLVIMLTGFAGCAALVGGAVVAVDDAVAESTAKREAVVVGKIGTPVNNAGMTYLVESASTKKELPGYVRAVKPKAGTVFILVNVELTNTKSESKTFLSNSAQFVGKNGAKYDTADATVSADIDDNLIMQQVDPDVPTSGVLVYEVPTKVVAGGSLVIEDLFGEGKVSVPLGLK
jgi:hypothetical protein